MNEEAKLYMKSSSCSIPSISAEETEKLTPSSGADDLGSTAGASLPHEVLLDSDSAPDHVGSPKRNNSDKEQIVDAVPSGFLNNSNQGFGADTYAEDREDEEEDVLEVDLAENPTTLCRLITHQYYERAIDRVNRRPKEAKTWLVSGVYRFLPLHMACDSLERVKEDPETEQQVNDLITLLVVTYPDGCYAPDPLQRLPIHQALWHRADPETISILLMGYPEALHTRDHEDRNLMEICDEAGGTYETSVKELLCLDLEFWKKSAMEAKLRMKRSNIAWAGSEVESTDPLAASQVDLESVFTSISNQRELARQSNMLNANKKAFESFSARKVRDVDNYSYKSGKSMGDQTGLSVAESFFELDDTSKKVAKSHKETYMTTPWTHLESRAAAAEYALYALRDSSTEIDHKLNDIQHSNREITEKLDHLNKEDLVKEVEGLRKDNRTLDERLARMEAMLISLASKNATEGITAAVTASPRATTPNVVEPSPSPKAQARGVGMSQDDSAIPASNSMTRAPRRSSVGGSSKPRRAPKVYGKESERVVRSFLKDDHMVKQISEIFPESIQKPETTSLKPRMAVPNSASSTSHFHRSAAGVEQPKKQNVHASQQLSRGSVGKVPGVVLTDSPVAVPDNDIESDDFVMGDMPKKLPIYKRCLPKMFRRKGNNYQAMNRSDRELEKMGNSLKPQDDPSITERMPDLSPPLAD